MAAIQVDHQGIGLISSSKCLFFRDEFLGWTPIHHAAFCDHVPILRLLYNKHPELLEQTTKDRLVMGKDGRKQEK